MSHRLFASALLAVVVTACGGDGTITEPTSRAKVTALAAIGTDPATGATIETNKDDYAPGEVVHLTGRGWAPNETVHLVMTEDPDTHDDVSLDVTADSVGGFSVHFYDVQSHDLGVIFTLTATGQTSRGRATATFRDGNVKFVTNPENVVTSLTYDLFKTPDCTDTPEKTAQTLTYGTGAIGISSDRSARVTIPSASGFTYSGYVAEGATTTISPASDPSNTTLCITGFRGEGSLTLTLNYTKNATVTNAAPELDAINNKTVDELTKLEFTATAQDDGLPNPPAALTYSLANPATGNFPAGAGITTAGVFTWTPTEVQGPATYRVKVVVSDGALSDEEEIEIKVNEVNAPPVLAAIDNQTINELTALTGVTASATDSDLPSNTLTYSLTTKPDGMTINSSTGAISWTPAENQDGVHSVTVQVSDGNSINGTDSKTFQVTVNEVNVAPTLDAIAAQQVNEGSPLSFTATAIDPDIVGGVAQQGQLTFSLGTPLPTYVTGTPAITSAGVFTWTPTDDDPTNTASDLYQFTVQVSDGVTPVPGTDTETAAVRVNNVAPVIVIGVNAPTVSVPTDPVGYPTAVQVSVNFTDVGAADTHANFSAVQWDAYLPFEKHGTNGTTVSVANGKLTASKSLPAGIYTVTVKVVDDDTGEATATATTFVVVYDPNGGFTTGGGWFISSATTDCPVFCASGASGKAHFGFVSKYAPGKTAPTGNTEFQFQAGNLKFHSTSYNALVVSGNRAQYWGSGVVNGVAGFTFRLTAVDGQVVGNDGTVDKFRIEIWQGGSWQANQPLGGTRIYDNQWNQGQEAQLSTAIEGGSIAIKTK